MLGRGKQIIGKQVKQTLLKESGVLQVLCGMSSLPKRKKKDKERKREEGVEEAGGQGRLLRKSSLLTSHRGASVGGGDPAARSRWP